MTSLLTFCGTLLLLESSQARLGHHFKELILRERIVPFDDSMDGDDYYRDLNDNRDSQMDDQLIATSTIRIPESTSHVEMTQGPGKILSEDTHETLSMTKDLQKEAKAFKRHQEPEKAFGNDSKVTENMQVQGQGNNSVAVKQDDNSTIPTSTEIPEDQDGVPKSDDACRYVFCRVGRVCVPSSRGRGKCVCAGPGHCKGSSRRVCGSDGLMYPSHCELHRSACLKGVHVSTDHSGDRCKGHLSNHSASASNPSSEGDLGDVSELTSTPHPMPSSSSSHCTKSDLKTIISKLISIHCSNLGINLNCTKVHDRHFVVSDMFRSYDQNGDNFLDEVESRKLSSGISSRCSLIDLLWSNSNDDRLRQISSTEFLSLFGVSLAKVDKSLKIYTTSVTVGNSVELKCNVKGIDRIVWKRKGNSLDDTVDKQIRVFDDGSLYIGDLRVDHMGNYSCHDRMTNDVIQTHVLFVQTLPQVKVHPSTQIHLSGSTVTVKCHAEGVPRPEIMWEKNEWPLLADDENHQRFLFLRNNTVLEIKSADYRYDTGAYKCKAKNSAGTSDQVAAVFIENVATSKHSSDLKQSELFAVFHDKGYTIYEVCHCHTEHQVTKDFRGFKISPGRQKTLDTLCPLNDTCSWSDAVLVKNKFIYIAQPQQGRIVVIERDRSNPIEVIPIKCSPDKLNYVESLDEVWVTCLTNEPYKDIVVVRQASSDHEHFPSEFPLTSRDSDQITGVYLPVANSLKHNFEYGYIAHGNSMMLKKLHLTSIAYAKEIDLLQYECIPTSVHFIPIGGLVMVGCRTNGSEVKPSFHLLLDYITDGLLERLEVNGDSYLSPDARRLVILGDRGNTAFVFKVSDEGVLQHVFDEYTQLQLDRLAFFPSDSGFDYDAFIATADQSTILHLDLESGRVSTMEGIEDLSADRRPIKTRHGDVIVGGSPFDEHLVTSSDKSVVAIDGKRRRILCQWSEVFNARVVIPLSEHHSD